jgi:hypothetical protein
MLIQDTMAIYHMNTSRLVWCRLTAMTILTGRTLPSYHLSLMVHSQCGNGLHWTKNRR